MSNITAKYMVPLPREVAAAPETPGASGEEISESSPATAAEMTYRIVKKLLDQLSPAERAECLWKLTR
jgi:hypothetical protein